MQYNYNVYQDPNEREKRALADGDQYVVVPKPLGMVLEEDEDGYVRIASVQPNGNAARSGVLRSGQIITAISATFGDEIWSVRGVGLDRVLKSIKVRQGRLVTVVFEDPNEVEQKKQSSLAYASRRAEEARDKFGERAVLDPVSWGAPARRAAGTDDASYDSSSARARQPESQQDLMRRQQQQQRAEERMDSGFQQPNVDPQLAERLKDEVTAPYRQQWLLWAVGGVAVIVLILFGTFLT